MSRFENLKAKINLLRSRLMGEGNAATLARGAASSFAIRMTGTGINFITQVVLARLLGVGSYGSYIYAITWITVLGVVGKLGFDTASVRFVAAYSTQQAYGLLGGYLRYSSQVILLISIGAGLCLGLVSWIFQARYSLELLHTFWIAGALLPLSTALEVQQSRLRALKKIIQGQLPQEVLVPLLVLVGTVIAAVWFKSDLDATTAMSIRLVAVAVALGISFYLLIQVLPKEVRVSQPIFKSNEWFRAALAMVLVTGFNMVVAQTGTIVLGATLGTKQVGMYAVASKIAELLVFILVAVNSILAPLVASLHAKGERTELQRIVRIGVWIVFAISLSIAVILLIFGRQLLSLFGAEFTASYPILVVLIVSQLINAMSGPVSLLLNMTGYHGDSAKILAISATINIGLNIAITPIYGAFGTALVTAITSLIWNGSMSIIVWYRLKIIAVAIPERIFAISIKGDN
ncbi:flippase [Aerosakkonema funiforme]|uniref:flippase n=1 Tax=Aerosakkonema funiforme TaxID=1246630 RepID=UPI001A7F037B|nr:flippase [Aerosakkonema funiforme]